MRVYFAKKQTFGLVKFTGRRWFLLVVPDDKDFGETWSQRHLVNDLVQRVEAVVGQDDGGKSGGLGRDQRQQWRTHHSVLTSS